MAHPTIINRGLLATCWTSAGDAAPSRGDETTPVDLRTRIETAAEIGWEGSTPPRSSGKPGRVHRSALELVDLVTAVGTPYGGLAVDIWHVHRGGTSYAELEHTLPLEYLFVVEVDDADAPVVGTLFEDSTNNRRLPGEGVFDVPAFLAAIHRIGHRGHWGVEIISEQHRQLPIREGLTRARAATLQALDAAEALVASAG